MPRPLHHSNFYSFNIYSFLVVIACIISSILMLDFFWVSDDAFISFRFAKNFAQGNGLRFNVANEIPVEGYSNLLWVLVAAFFEFFGIPSFKVVPYLSIPLALLLVWRVYRAALNYCGCSASSACMAAITLAFFPPLIIWGTSGLEPIPFALLTFLVFEQIFLKATPNFAWLCCYGIGLSLIRSEGALWALTFAVIAFVFLPEKRALAIRFGVFILLLIIAHTSFRYIYYQAFVPNTASAKLAFNSERLGRGLNYVIAFALTFITPLLAIVALVARPTRFVFLIFLGFIGFYSYSVISGGDYMTMGRFLLPAAVFQTLLLAILFERLRKWNVAIAYLTFFSFAIFAFMPLYNSHVIPKKVRAKFHFRLNTNRFWSEIEQWAFMKENSRRWRYKGELIKQHSQPGDSLVEGTIGNVGYFSELYIHDRLGLITKLDRTFMRKVMRSPGHDMKAPLNYFLPHKPTFTYANLERLDRFRRISELKDRFPYAPFIYPAKFAHERNYAFIMFKRVDTREEYDRQWAILRNSIKK